MLPLGDAAVVADPNAGIENTCAFIDHGRRENAPTDVGHVAVDRPRSDDRTSEIRRPDLVAGHSVECIDPVAHAGLEDQIAGLAIGHVHAADRQRLRLEPWIVGNPKAEEFDDALRADGGRRQHRFRIVRTGTGVVVAAGRDGSGHG
ncbi:hypothetical protein ACVWZZ_003355 [Bradyrhizobium sp. LM6.10]